MNQSDWPKNSENSKSDRKGKERMSVGSSANNSKQQPQLTSTTRTLPIKD
jgi:hypothetical protein